MNKYYSYPLFELCNISRDSVSSRKNKSASRVWRCLEARQWALIRAFTRWLIFLLLSGLWGNNGWIDTSWKGIRGRCGWPLGGRVGWRRGDRHGFEDLSEYEVTSNVVSLVNRQWLPGSESLLWKRRERNYQCILDFSVSSGPLYLGFWIED